MTTASLSVQELRKQLQSKQPLDLIDVRSPGEYAGVHIPEARNVPLNGFKPEALLAQRGEDAPPLVLICHGGQRSRDAAAKLEAAGCSELTVVEGGTKAWIDAGFAVNRGQGSIPLDRQLQMVIGLLVVTGVALGFFIHPYWLALPAFVGLGLFNAGLTGICPLAMVMAAMPWNRGCGKVTSCSVPNNSQQPS